MNRWRNLPAEHHQRIALGYAVITAAALIVGSLLALGLGLQALASQGSVDVTSFRQLYSVHGLLMVFAVVVPAIPAVLGNWWLPNALGLEAMALPHLNRLGLHLHALGVVLLLAVAVLVPSDAGWSFELPWSLQTSAPLAWSLLAMATVAAGTLCWGANLVWTLVSCAWKRGWRSLPILAWGLGIAACIQTLIVPWLWMVLALFFAERSGGADTFSAIPAGDLRFEQWFWLWSQPALAATLLTALGVIGEVVKGNAAIDREARLGEVVCLLSAGVLLCLDAGAYSLGAVADPLQAVGTGALTLSAIIPVLILIAQWGYALLVSEVTATPALAWAGVSLATLCIGGAGALCLALPPTASQLRDTSFVTATMHYLLAGGVLFALIAGIYQAWPKWWGLQPRAAWAFLGCTLTFLGVNCAFAPLFVLGYLGQPRRTTTWLAGSESLALVSAAGTVLVVLGLAVVLWNLVEVLFHARPATQEAT